VRKIRVKNYSDVYIGEYPFHKELKDELVPLLENYPDKQGRQTNVVATMTEWDWNPENDRLNRLKNNIIEFTNYNCAFMKGDSNRKNERYFMMDFWGNIYRKGDYTEPHSHRPSVFSCVYFLKTKWYHSPLIFKSRWDEPISKRIRPKEGTFVIFPAHLNHLVPKHRYNETRITLSGNMRIKESL
tara:strand:- start:545 stop:1099 length:555 start_codon:yes stop_codon:yes gene_type:complete